MFIVHCGRRPLPGGVGLTAREAALKALGAYRRKKAWPDLSLYVLIGEAHTTAPEKALALQILRGVMQNTTYCDFITSKYSSFDIKKIHPVVLDILRISIYQILFLTKIPYSAAVNEGVMLAKKHSNPRAAGFINAVLRKVANSAEQGSLPDIPSEDFCRYLSVKYSHPEWLVRDYCARLGKSGAELLLAADNSPVRPVTAQVNTLLADTGEVVSSLAADGVNAARHEWLDDCIELHNPGQVGRLSVFRKGFIYIQDAASRLAVIAADPKPGDFVVDGCAAPGGKSFAAAILMKDTGHIAACDINAAKLNRINETASRLGFGVISVKEQDAREQETGMAGSADIVIADVPCSGFGVIRKKPEIRYKTQEEIGGLPDLQKRILFNLSSYVKPGGTLVYSTCTTFKCENENVVESFLLGHSEFSPVPFRLPGIGDVPDGMVTLWPHIHGTDGFFICKMVRN